MSQFDVALLRWINGHHHPAADAILGPVALSGEVGLLMGLLLVSVFWVGPLKEWRSTLALGLMLLALDRLVMQGSQVAAFRERPYIALQGITQAGLQWKTSSFPSGHSHTAWLVTIVLGLRWPRTLWFMVPYLILTLYSRPYFGMHYPSDVLGGSVSGILLGVFIANVQRRKYGTLAGRRVRQGGNDRR